MLPLLKNLKTYMIIAALIFIAAAVIGFNLQMKKIAKQKQEIERLKNNNSQLLADGIQIQNLILKQKEVTGRIKRERDSLAAVVKVKPKYIEKIITIDNTVFDTLKVTVPVYNAGPYTWKIEDGNKCFKWAAIAYRKGDSLKVQRTLFQFNNRTVQTFWKKAPRFIGIRVGKWKYYQKIDAECGDVKYQAITFEK